MYPNQRNRRLRQSPAIRQLVSESQLTVNDMMLPLFVTEGTQVKEPISAMPGCYRLSLDLLQEEVKSVSDMGIKALLLFVMVDDALKDNKGTEALNPEGLMQRAVRTVKTTTPEMVVMTDVALDPYSSYGHDGIVEEVGLRSTRIRTLEGRIVTIPNCAFTDNSVINVTSQPALKVKLNLGLTYDTNEDDMQKAIDILEDIVKNQDAITDDYAAGFNGFGDFSLNILFIYYVKPDSHWLDTQTLVNKEILKRFNKEKLDFAFPTQTVLKKDI